MRLPTILLLAIFPLTLAVGFINQATPAWTPKELAAANTAKNVTYMDSVEKEIVMYCNLARMYPKRFAAIEVDGHYYGEDAVSLAKELRSITPRTALQPDSALTANANCFQVEQGKSGERGHLRKECTTDMRGENCSYGKSNALSVIMQLMVDEGIPSHGHRWNILNAGYTKIGVALGEHKTYFHSAVLDFK
jgi:uncharacterized protein YkwD